MINKIGIYLLHRQSKDGRGLNDEHVHLTALFFVHLLFKCTLCTWSTAKIRNLFF